MKIVTLDVSTKFTAYALWSDDELHEYGKIYAVGVDDIGIGSMSGGIANAFEGVGVDVVVYESTFLGSNVNVVKQLSKTTGAVIGSFHTLGVRNFIAIPPITWQTGIGVGKTSTKEKDHLRQKHPDRSVSWLKNKDRDNRKQKIIDYVNNRFDKHFTMSDNDIADAIGIGCYFNDMRKERDGVQAKVV